MVRFIIFIILFLGVICINYNISEVKNMENSCENTQSYDKYEPVQNNSPIFISSEIPDNIYENMIGKSIPVQYVSKVDKTTLSYLQLSYIGFDGNSHIGEMIVNSKVSSEILEIFKKLYEIEYQIEKIKLIDEYNANDEVSMSDNNTSCFCYRVVSGTSRLSNHSYRLCHRYKSFV